MSKVRKGYWINLIYYPLTWLPLSVAYALAKKIAWLLKRCNGRDYRTIQTNIKACFPELNTTQQQTLIDQTLLESCKGMLETPIIWSRSVAYIEKKISHITRQELLTQAVAEDTGLMLICPHFGNWELLDSFLKARSISVTTLYRPALFRSLNRIMLKARLKNGNKLAATDKQGIKTLLTAAKLKETIAILPDQDPGKEGGDYVPFFGIQTNTMSLCYKIAKRTQCNIIFAYVQRLPEMKYEVRFESFPEWASKSLTQIEFATAMNQSIERSIRSCPSQYNWTYKRFRRSPNFEY